MPTITFIEHNGTRHEVHAEVGQSAMQAATFAGRCVQILDGQIVAD